MLFKYLSIFTSDLLITFLCRFCDYNVFFSDNLVIIQLAENARKQTTIFSMLSRVINVFLEYQYRLGKDVSLILPMTTIEVLLQNFSNIP